MPTSYPLSVLFGESAVVSCERAVAELRAGRPIILRTADDTLFAYLALDNCTPSTLDAFAQATDQAHYLLLTASRMNVLCAASNAENIRISAQTLDYSALLGLAYQPDVAAPTHWHSADATDAQAIALARWGLLLPCLVAAQITPVQAQLFTNSYCIQAGAVDTTQSTSAHPYRLAVKSPVPLADLGMCEVAVFRGGVALRDQVAVLIGSIDTQSSVPVRVHSSCLTGDLLGSLKCDCGDQLRAGLRAIKNLGSGVLIYLDQEGRGTGIAAKMHAYGYQHNGMDTIDADAQLGFAADERRFESAAGILRALGITQIQLLSNNPSKVEKLSALGITVTDRLPVTGMVTKENAFYLRTKAQRAGHQLDVDSLLQHQAHSSRD